MSKKCARCEKTVYPLEELKCLDKIWHKGCFKCHECSMTLNMKTYKGFNKLPYCEAHIPKAKATAVAETPEMKRLAENTKNQSNVQYHADFEKSKARFTAVADDPETLRLRTNSRNISNVEYHGGRRKEERPRSRSPETEEQAQMATLEQLQHLRISGKHAQPAAHQITVPREQPGAQLSTTPPQQQPQPPRQHTYTNNNHHQPPPQHRAAVQLQQQQYNNQQNNNSPYSASRGQQTLVYSSQQGGQVAEAESRAAVGRIADYDPVNEQYGSAAGTRRQDAQAHRASYDEQRSGPQYDRQQQQYQQQQQQYHQQQQQQQQQQQRAPQPQQQPPQPQYQYQQQQPPQYHPQQQPHYQQQQPSQYQPQQQQQQPTPQQQQYQLQQQKISAQPTNLGRCYQALYDYDASDSDEVTFCDGDLLVNCSGVDGGWMTGTVQRTGLTGMLPANYVRRVS